MRQKPCLAASLASASSMNASSSCLGESAPQGPPPLRLSGPCGQADCHRSASVDIIGGRTGLFSSIRSSSSITLDDRRGSSCRRRCYNTIQFDGSPISFSVLPAATADSDAAARPRWRPAEGTERAHASVTKQSIAASGCSRASRPAPPSPASDHSVVCPPQCGPCPSYPAATVQPAKQKESNKRGNNY